jgi:hypothetical protein
MPRQHGRVSQSRQYGLGIALVAAALLVLPAAAQAQPSPPSATWAVTLVRTTPYASLDDDAEALADLPALTLLQVERYVGDWAEVSNPRTHERAFVDSRALGPSDPPSRYLTMTPPPAYEEFAIRGIVTDTASLAIYPSPSDEAVERPLDPNTWLRLTGAVQGEDGALWYRTDTDDYISGDAVFIAERTEDFGGRWLDVDLTVPTHVTLYEAGQEVDSFLAIKGAGTRPTPTGVFSILRRVANETMNSDTIGIPRFGPGGYYLTNVLFTQYFTGDGASLHYNYWSSAFGYAGSHGCLGLTYKDSAFLWQWAHVGTPLIIHY